MSVIDQDPVAAVHRFDPVETPRRRRRGYNSSRFVPIWWALPGAVLVFLVHYAATAAGGVYAFTDWNGIGKAEFIGIQNFIDIFERPEMVLAVGNTFLIGACVVVGTNGIGLGLALLLNRMLKTRYLLRTLLFIPTVLSSLAVSYVWLFIFEYDGPLNGFLVWIGAEDAQRLWTADPDFAIWTIIIVTIWQGTGIPMLIFLAGLAGVPVELEEAAMVDGASIWARFRHITLPMLRPALFMSLMLSIINSLRIFDPIIALTGGGPYGATEALSTQVYKQTFAYGNFGFGAALSVVLTIIILALAIVQFAMRRKED